LALQDVTPDLATRLGLDEPKGAFVVSVQPGSAAARAGILPQDVILSVNGEDVESVDSFWRILSRVDLEEGARLFIQSEGATRFVFLRMPR
jgi:S1-C subfamily serine protease